jgi:hypothetical protein
VKNAQDNSMRFVKFGSLDYAIEEVGVAAETMDEDNWRSLAQELDVELLSTREGDKLFVRTIPNTISHWSASVANLRTHSEAVIVSSCYGPLADVRFEGVGEDD